MDRDDLLARYRRLVLDELPARARREGWVVSADHAVPAGLWHPAVPTPQGLADTAAWYRSEGLL